MALKYKTGIEVPSLRLGTSATAGHVPTADASGNLTLQAPSGGGGGGTPAYTAYIGNGSATSFTINHNLGTRDVNVIVYQAASPYMVVDAETTIDTVNAITISGFGTPPTTNQYRVVVQASSPTTIEYESPIIQQINKFEGFSHDLDSRTYTYLDGMSLSFVLDEATWVEFEYLIPAVQIQTAGERARVIARIDGDRRVAHGLIQAGSFTSGQTSINAPIRGISEPILLSAGYHYSNLEVMHETYNSQVITAATIYWGDVIDFFGTSKESAMWFVARRIA